MAAVIALGVNADTTNTGRVSLADGTAFKLPIEQVHFGMNFFKGGVQWGEFERDALRRGTQPPSPTRELVFGVLAQGANRPAIQANIHKLQTLLKQARDASRLGALGSPVVLVFQDDATALETYLDVVAGRIDRVDRPGLATAGFGQGYIVTLSVLPYARQQQTASVFGTSVSYTASGTILDVCATYRLTDAGGDADGLLHLVLTDSTTIPSGHPITQVIAGRRSLSPLGASDFSPIQAVTAFNSGNSSTFTDATARGGTTARLTPTSSALQQIGYVTQPGTGLAQGGEVAIWARLRDSSPYIDPTNAAGGAAGNVSVSASTAAGALPPGTYTCRLATVDSNGVESAACYPATATIPNSASGLYDTFSGGTLANWDNSGYTQFYRNGTTVTTTAAGTLAADPGAAFEGTYGCRAGVRTDVAWASTDYDVWRCVLQKAADGVATNTTGTSTVYGRFRVNSIVEPDGTAQSFVVFFSAAQGNTSGAVAGYQVDYNSITTSSSGVLVGLRYIGGDIWQLAAPYGGASNGGGWFPLPGHYVTITPGNWYNFLVTVSVVPSGAGADSVTLNNFVLNGIQISGTQTTTQILSGFPTTGAVLIPTIGAEMFGQNINYDVNDQLQIDFDDVGAFAGTATTGELVPTWNAVTNGSSYVFYYALSEAPTSWGRITGASSGTPIAAAATSAATLPQSRSSGTTAPALVTAQVGVSATSGDYITTSGGQPRYGQSLWEWVNLGTVTLPPVPRQDGAGLAPWAIVLYGQAGGANVSTIDCDTIVLMPTDEDQIVATAPTVNAASGNVWTFDLNRLDRQSVAVTVGGTTNDYASVAGRLSAGQGDTELIVLVANTDSRGHYTPDLAHCRFALSATVQPRYESF